MYNEDEILLSRIRNNEEAAFNELFHKYYKFMKIEAYYILKDTAQAEDAAQDILINLWKRRENLKIDTSKISIKIYLFMAVKNHCNYIFRSSQKHKKIKKYLLENSLLSYNNENIENKELFNLINLAVKNISTENLSNIFRMRFFEFKSNIEIAAEYKLNSDIVKKRLSRAVKEVRDYLNLRLVK